MYHDMRNETSGQGLHWVNTSQGVKANYGGINNLQWNVERKERERERERVRKREKKRKKVKWNIKQ